MARRPTHSVLSALSFVAAKGPHGRWRLSRRNDSCEKGAKLRASNETMTVEVLYGHVDHIGMVPQVNQKFPCEEAPEGALLVVEIASIIRGGHRVGWTVKGRP